MHAAALVIDLTARERAADPFCFVSPGPMALLLDLRKTHQQPAHFDTCLLHKV